MITTIKRFPNGHEYRQHFLGLAEAYESARVHLGWAKLLGWKGNPYNYITVIGKKV